MRFLILLIAAVLFAKDVTLQFNWLPQFEFAGYIIAKEKGFYKKEGLNVKFLYYNPKITVMDAVKSKKADFGIEEIDVFEKYLKGESFKAVAAIFQDSPHALMSIKEYNITNLTDLKNKKLALKYGKKIPVGIQLMLLSNGLKLSDFKLYPVTFNIDNLINKKYDAITVYISNEPFLLKQKGYTPVIFSPKDYGFHFYSGIIFTTNEYLSNNPETVRKFVKATFKGWKWAFSHIDETVDLIYKKYNLLHKTKDALKFEADVLKRLAGKNMGKISEERLEEICNYYKLLGIKVKKDIKNFIYNPQKVNLTEAERNYLKTHNTVKICIDPNWPPIEYYENGRVKGIAQDVLKIIAEKLNVRFKIVNTNSWKESVEFFKEGKCQMLAEAVKTKEREKFAYFTKPYLRYKMAFITRQNVPFIGSIKDVSDKIMAREENSALIAILKEKYPYIKILKTKSTLDAFKAVADGRAYYTLAILPVASYINYKYLLNLHIAGYSDISYDISMAVNKKYPYLFSAVSKALDTIEPSTVEPITKKYMYSVISQVDYKLIIIVVSVFGLLIVFLYYRHFLLKKMNKSLEKEVKKAVFEKLKALYVDSVTGCFSKIKMKEDKNSEKYIIILNIKNFSKINSVYGFATGDKVLKVVCDRLKRIKQNVYRLDADEFIIFSDDYKKDIKKINEIFDKEIRVGGFYFKLSFYFGITQNDADFLRHLTVAVKKAKADLIEYYFYKEEDKGMHGFFKFNKYLSNAVKKEEGYSIEPYFQGIYSHKSGKIEKYEALARLIVKDKVYTPYYFIDIAKTSGFITDLTNIMIDKSMKCAKECDFDVSINLTEEDFLRNNLIDFIVEKTQKYNLKPSQITFEILENIANRQMNVINDKLKTLKKLGFKIAIDDFGVENSNFEKVADLEIDYVKIDGKYIKNIHNDEKLQIIVESIVYFAHKLDIKVIAEFVENEEIDNILKRLNVDFSQGYLYSKPHKKDKHAKEN